jgi:hypothetical protein
MNKKELIERLSDIPDDYDFVLSRVHAYTMHPREDLSEEEKKDAFPDGNVPETMEMQINVDIPMIGVLISNESKEIRFLITPKDARFIEKQYKDTPDFLKFAP